MSAYTVSQLAHNAGVSVHIVRLTSGSVGLLRPVACTTGGYGVFDGCGLATAVLRARGLRGGVPAWMPARLRCAPDAADGVLPQRSLPCCASWSSGGARRWPIWTRNWPPCQPSGRTRRHCRERLTNCRSRRANLFPAGSWGALAVLTCPAIRRRFSPCWLDELPVPPCEHWVLPRSR